MLVTRIRCGVLTARIAQVCERLRIEVPAVDEHGVEALVH